MATGQAGPPPPERRTVSPEVMVQEQRPLLRLTDPVPLFAEPGRRFTRIKGATVARRGAGSVELDVELLDGGRAALLIEGTASGAVHLLWRCPRDARLPVTPADGML